VREISMGQYILTIEAATLTELKAQLRQHLAELEGQLPVQTQLRFSEEEPAKVQAPETTPVKAVNPKEPKHCRTCSAVLGDENWSPSLRAGYVSKRGNVRPNDDLQCSKCRREITKRWNERNRKKEETSEAPAEKPVKSCVDCGRTETPQWRNGGKQCNACYFRDKRAEEKKEKDPLDRKRKVQLPKAKKGSKRVETTAPAKVESSKPTPSLEGFFAFLTENYPIRLMEMEGVLTPLNIMKAYYEGLRGENWEMWSTGPTGAHIQAALSRVFVAQEKKAPTVFMTQKVSEVVAIILMDADKRKTSVLLSKAELERAFYE
jgi:hypothetical protein